MKTYKVYCNLVYKGTYKATWQGGATLQGYMEHGDTICPQTGTIGNWTAVEQANSRTEEVK